MTEITEKRIPHRKGLAAAEQLLLTVYILLSPIYQCFPALPLIGLNPMTVLVGLLLLCYALHMPSVLRHHRPLFGSVWILLVFCAELVWFRADLSIGWILPVLLYLFFLQTDHRISATCLEGAYLISVLLAAVCSVSLGLVDGAVTRVATLIDGSIAPIAITAALFCDRHAGGVRALGWLCLRGAALICGLIVLIFGMSRARFLIIGAVFVLYFCRKLRQVFPGGRKISRRAALLLYFILLAMAGLLASGILDDLFAPILRRLTTEGLDSMGRDVELIFGLSCFSGSPIIGCGWGQMYLTDLDGSVVAYNNHCAYLAILARGGLALALPMLFSYAMLFLEAWGVRHRCAAAVPLMTVFFLLSIGNAGMFNYTIGSLIPLVVLKINQKDRDLE